MLAFNLCSLVLQRLSSYVKDLGLHVKENWCHYKIAYILLV